MIASYVQTLRLFSHDVRMYLLTAAVFGFSYFGVMTVLLNLYLLRLGYGPEFIGLVNGSTSLAFAGSSLIAGMLGSYWGYRRSVIVGMFLVFTATMLLPLMEFSGEAWRDSGIISTRVLSGFGFALYFVNANPYLVAATNPKERNHVFSMQVALSPFAGFAGSLIAGILPGVFAAYLSLPMDHPAPYRYPLFLAGLILIPAIMGLYTTKDIPIVKRLSRADGGEGASAAPYLLIAFLGGAALFRMAGEGAARSFFNVYLDADLGVSTARIGTLTAVGQLLAGPVALAVPFMINRTGKVPTVIWSTFGIAGSLVLMGLVPHWASAGLGFMGVIGMLTITRAVINVVQMEIVAPDWRSMTSGITSMAMGIGFSSMALGGGYIIPLLGFRGFFLIGASMVAASALLFWSYFRIPRGEYAHVGARI